jgi:peroxiredoxin
MFYQIILPNPDPQMEPTFDEVFPQITTRQGDNLKKISDERPVLLVFLRHFGCNFCREAMADICKARPKIEANGTCIVLVHMSDEETAARYFKKYKIDDIASVSDPELHLYKAFGLARGTINQIMGFRSFLRGFKTIVIDGHGAGAVIGDGLQMPGVFMIYKGEIRDSYIHQNTYERPDYLRLSQCCSF